MTETFSVCGGVENRVQQYCRLWQKHGWQTYIAPTMPSAKLPFLEKSSSRHGCINTLLLCWWRLTRNVRVVEWQSGSDGKVRFSPKVLKAFGIKTGIVFHGRVGQTVQRRAWQTDYQLCVSPAQQKRCPALKACPYVNNALELDLSTWSFENQKKALLVSRLDRDKIPSVRAFVRFCIAQKMVFDVAGSGNAAVFLKQWATKQCALAKLPAPLFRGSINTLAFLKEHKEEYLFIGGVGQVVLEALSLGYPALLASLTGQRDCFFIKPHNIKEAAFYNFSLHDPQESRLFAKEQARAKEDLAALRCGEAGPFKMAQADLERFDLKHAFKKYWQIVFPQQTTKNDK